MKIEIKSENKIKWNDTSSNFQNDDVTVKMEIKDNIEKVMNGNYTALFTISLNMEIFITGSSNIIFESIIEGIYEVNLNKDTTLNQLAMVYLRPHAFFKNEFNNYKKNKSIATIEVPELKEDHPNILSTFKTKLPDLFN